MGALSLSAQLGLSLGTRRGGGGAPYLPALRFNDARNSQYLVVSNILRR